jgi:murein L,D-transpeptidase YafK
MYFIQCFCIEQPCTNIVYRISKKFPRVAGAIKAKEDTIKKQFIKAGLQWYPNDLYLRSFKFDSQLEVWGRNNKKESYKLVKSYRVCALSGGLGPKRMQGDYQVPEGFIISMNLIQRVNIT